jgi:hypothetical protein
MRRIGLPPKIVPRRDIVRDPVDLLYCVSDISCHLGEPSPSSAPSAGKAFTQPAWLEPQVVKKDRHSRHRP